MKALTEATQLFALGLVVVCGMALTIAPFLLYTCTRVGWRAWTDLLSISAE